MGRKMTIVSRVDLTKTKPELWGYAMAKDNQYLLYNVKAYATLFNLTNYI